MGSIYDMKVYGEHTNDAFSMINTTVARHGLAAPPHIHEVDDAFYIPERTLELLAGTRTVEGFFSLTTTSLQGSRSRPACLPDPLDCNHYPICGAGESGPGCIDRVNSRARDRGGK